VGQFWGWGNFVYNFFNKCTSEGLHKAIHQQWSNNETYALQEKQDSLHIPKHELIKECITRWSSCYKMLERVLEQQQALYAVLMEKKRNT